MMKIMVFLPSAIIFKCFLKIVTEFGCNFVSLVSVIHIDVSFVTLSGYTFSLFFGPLHRFFKNLVYINDSAKF